MALLLRIKNMKINYAIEPPNGLLEKILKRIQREQRILVIKRSFVFSVFLIASTVSFWPISNMLLSDFLKSGFFYFFSLLFSDFSIVMVHWQSFAMMLLETLPAVSLALFLAVLLIFLQSAKSLAKNINIISNGRLLPAR